MPDFGEAARIQTFPDSLRLVGTRQQQCMLVGNAGIFVDELAKTLLLVGKHLVLINAINDLQDAHGAFADEQQWLDAIEEHLEDEGLLKRNPGRHAAAVRHSGRGFLKAEKTIWRNLDLIVPRGKSGELILSCIAANISRRTGFDAITDKPIPFALNALNNLGLGPKQDSGAPEGALLSSLASLLVPAEISSLNSAEYR